jgi:hypothetical protein
MKGRNQRSQDRGFRVLGKQSLLGGECMLLLLLSAGDLFVTYRMLWEARFYEANPVARFFFERWNIAGMTAFKFGVIAFVFVLAEAIEKRRPGVGRAIVMLGCVAAAAAMFHGLRLLHGG